MALLDCQHAEASGESIVSQMQDLFADQHELMLGESPGARSARPARGQEAGSDGLEGQEAGEDGQETAGGGEASARRPKDADASTGPKPSGSRRGGQPATPADIATSIFKSKSSPEGGGDDHLTAQTAHMHVDEIQDWGQFQQKLTKTARCQLPTAILKAADLKIEAWNNIPIPVVHSAKAFERCLVNTSSIIVELVRELREKTIKIVQKFNIVDKEASRSAQAADQTVALTRKVLTSRLEDMFERSNALINIQQDKLG